MAEQTSPPPGKRLAKLGEASGLALVAALICALPTAYRTSAAGGSFGDGLLIGCAVMLLVMWPVALLLPKAARGFRGVVGTRPTGALWVGIAMALGVTLALSMLLAALLEVGTHHRGLGGATYGVLGAAILLGAAVLAGRLVAIGQALLARGWPRRLLIATAAFIALGPAALVVVALLRGGEASAGTQAVLLDLLLGAAVAVMAFRRDMPAALSRPAWYAALPLAAAVLIAGMLRVESSAPSAEAVGRGGGLPAAVLVALESWTDQDGDGNGAHFGGRDCDEGDPARGPGATEVAGDGRDSDCDGDDDPIRIVAEVLVVDEPTPPEALAASGSTVAAKAPQLPAQPDVILITLDTVRADRTSLYGYAEDTTPNLKRLAERALVFERAYAAGSDTQRALMPLVSGMPLSETSHTNKEWPRVLDEVDTVAERMSAAGYATRAVTTFTWLRKDRGFAQGFGELDESPWQERHPEREHTSDLAIASAKKQYALLSAGDKPLFLWVHLFDPHDKFVAHPAHDYGDGLEQRYLGEIAYTDAQLGQLIDHVAQAGRAARTLWVIHGSHGEAFGEHGQVGHGVQLYDESVRVPLMIAGPGVTPGRFNARAVSILDVAPTLLDVAGARRDGVHGVSLRPAMTGDADFTRDPVLSYARRRVTLVDWPLKLMVFRRDKRDDRLLLFDLESDPGETKDLSSERPDDLKRLDALRRELEQGS